MSDFDSPDQPHAGRGYDLARLLPQRSFGLKLLLVCGLALLMAFPAAMVWQLYVARAYDARAAITEVNSLLGGQQTLMGPAITVPYDFSSPEGTTPPRQPVGRVVLYADTGTANATLATEIRKRGLHDVPAYTADVAFAANFSIDRLLAEMPSNARLRWNEARIWMGMGDLRAARDAKVVIGGRSLELGPADNSSTGTDGQLQRFTGLLAAPLGWTMEAPPTSAIAATATLKVSGAEHIGFAVFARDTTISMAGNWPSPSFDGGALPDQRTVAKDGFTATWRIPFLARGAPGAGADLTFDSLVASSPGVSLLDEGSPYQAVERALKYAPLFIGLVFLTYFLFEATGRKRAHPAQYVLVGLAQTVFYLLLLSISEVLGFSMGFGIAASATVLALSLYAMSVFASLATGAKALVVFSALYGLIYVLLRTEDYALLVGSIASFLAITGTMWMTRKLDWYGVGRNVDPAPEPAAT